MMEVKLTPAPLPPPPPPQVTITLSYKEACGLLGLCGKVAGPQLGIRNKLTSPLYNKLSSVLGQVSTDWPEPFTYPMHSAEGFWESLPDRP